MLPDDEWFEILAQAPVQGTDTLKCDRFSSVDIPSNDVTVSAISAKDLDFFKSKWLQRLNTRW